MASSLVLPSFSGEEREEAFHHEEPRDMKVSKLLALGVSTGGMLVQMVFYLASVCGLLGAGGWSCGPTLPSH